jgi:hypothetical protein
VSNFWGPLHYVELRNAATKQVADSRSFYPSLEISTSDDGWTCSRGLCVKDWKTLCEAAAHFGEASNLCDQVTTWAKKYSLLSDWFLDATWLNVCIWCHADENHKSLLFTLPGIYVVTEKGRAASGTGLLTTTRHQPELLPRGAAAAVPLVPPYNPVATTRAEYRKRIDGIIRNYCPARLRDPPLEQRRTSGGGLSVISGSTVCQKLMFMAQQPCRKLKFLAYPTEPF